MARICRQISLHDARGESAATAQLRQGPLEQALGAFRAEGISEELIASQLATIAAAEEERVANAILLAEVLVPILAGEFAQSLTPKQPAVPSAAASKVEIDPVARSKRGANGVPAAGIADFIDQMLAQEQPEPPKPLQRRAS